MERAAAAGLVAGATLLVHSELMLVLNASSSTRHVARGHAAHAPATHARGAAVATALRPATLAFSLQLQNPPQGQPAVNAPPCLSAPLLRVTPPPPPPPPPASASPT